MKEKVNISYVIFNQDWDSFAKKKKILCYYAYHNYNNLYQKNLIYLKYSLTTLLQNITYKDFTITIWIVELDPTNNTLHQEIKKLTKAMPHKIKLRTIRGGSFKKMIDMMAENPENEYAYSASNIHEYCLYHALLNTKEKYVYFNDIDILYTESSFVDFCLHKLKENKNKVVCAFLEDASKISEFNTILTRMPRLHTFSIFFDREKLSKQVDLKFLSKNMFNHQILIQNIKSKQIQDFINKTPLDKLIFDTFTFMTDALLGKGDDDAIIDLRKTLSDYISTDDPIICGCEYFIHGKYLYNKHFVKLLDGIQKKPKLLKSLNKTLRSISSQ